MKEIDYRFKKVQENLESKRVTYVVLSICSPCYRKLMKRAENYAVNSTD